jgi:hypothetical protein
VAIKILNEKIVFDDKLILEKAELSDGENTFSRLRVNRPDAAAILIFNTESKKKFLPGSFVTRLLQKLRLRFMKLPQEK